MSVYVEAKEYDVAWCKAELLLLPWSWLFFL